MRIRKPFVDPDEAAAQIRAGTSDEVLMDRYDLNRRGLRSLLKKLVRAGKLKEADIGVRECLTVNVKRRTKDSGSGGRGVTKLDISLNEAVQAVRSGMSDLALMEKFSLSAKGVDKLLRKLVKVGAVEQAELDRRMYSSQMVRVMQLDDLPEPVVPKPRINAAEAVSLIRSDATDLQLMEKYSISTKGLESLFRKLVLAGEIMQTEIDHRKEVGGMSPSEILEELLDAPPNKPRIKASDAVSDVLSGLSDLQLMAKYSISADQLENLFKKLVRGGHIDQAEVDRRAIVSQLSHFVELEERLEPAVTKPTIRTAEIAADLRSGMSDAALMEKYQLSVSGLSSLLISLVASGALARSELDARRNSFTWADLAWRQEQEGPLRSRPDEPPDEDPEFELVAARRKGFVRRLWRNHEVATVAVAGAFIGMLSLALGLHLADNLDGWWSRLFKPKTATISDPEFHRRVEAFASILEDIAREARLKKDFEAAAEIPDLKGCLENCKKQYASPDPADDAFLVLCRKECLATHSKVINAIRQRYYGGWSIE
ncbi:MAG: hypothetical protein HY914_12530 [Desulfomonile tiedjei]|nr:hypothetical protein [Desulfomonile tiedjei]